MLQVFLKDGKKKSVELKTSFEERNISLYTTYVHGLKSACAIIGAEKLSEDAKALEQASKQGDLLYIQEHNDILLSDLELLLENIHQAIIDESPDKRDDVFDMSRLIKTLTDLGKALDAFDLSEINQGANILQEYAQAPGIGDTIEAIIHNKMIGAYEMAISEINGLLGKINGKI
jgi:HPt (histidine-containing phosphotransfer) domain-containing protein